jgi:hypothetical protein
MLTIKEHTPIGVLRAIRQRYPKLNGERLQRTFEAVVVEDAEVRRGIIQRAYASALQELMAPPSPPV